MQTVGRILPWLALGVVSLLLHLAAGVILPLVSLETERHSLVRIRIVEPEQVSEASRDDHERSLGPLQDGGRPKPRKTPATERRTTAREAEEKRVAGLDATAVEADGRDAAPVGNTLLQEDTGERQGGAALSESAPSAPVSKPRLIKESIRIPEYTDAALDANLQGRVAIDVFVDAQGEVVETRLARRVGYGMDERLLEAARGARFVPGKDPSGEAVSSWTQIIFDLQIPD